MAHFDGMSAVVTGAGGGIGRGIALALAGEGAKVALFDINQDLLDEAVAEAGDLDVTAFRCDVADREAVTRTLDGFASQSGGLDILVNNAVAFHYAPLEVFPEAEVHKMLDVGLKGTYWAIQAATPHLKKSDRPSILNLSSIAVSMAIGNAGVYSSIKGAIDALTRQQAAELGPYGIRVNALAPGSVVTPGASSVITEQGWKERQAKTVLDRLPTIEDINRAAVFLCSQDARCITGITLKIDSGMTIKGA
ncbi:SDR family NAD(P)-dependent oxidoreductase [Roseovarius tibetensis]|uniref:SDR family NAD(P)-dependent oxidoreductase n=1 Tax=Roseovarius tibetensis TaxID=2685897 RepID=UPI003D7F282C